MGDVYQHSSAHSYLQSQDGGGRVLALEKNWKISKPFIPGVKGIANMSGLGVWLKLKTCASPIKKKLSRLPEFFFPQNLQNLLNVRK